MRVLFPAPDELEPMEPWRMLMNTAAKQNSKIKMRKKNNNNKKREENAKSLDLVIMLKCRKDKHMDPLCL